VWLRGEGTKREEARGRPLLCFSKGRWAAAYLLRWVRV